MNKKVLYTLEYNKITEQLAAHASSDWAKEHCIHLKPMTDLAKIEQAQAETSAALSRIYRKGNISFSGIHKIGMSLALKSCSMLLLCWTLRSVSRHMAEMIVKTYPLIHWMPCSRPLSR